MIGSYLLNLRLIKSEMQDLWQLGSIVNIYGLPASPLISTLVSGITKASTGAAPASTATSQCSLFGLSNRLDPWTPCGSHKQGVHLGFRIN